MNMQTGAAMSNAPRTNLMHLLHRILGTLSPGVGGMISKSQEGQMQTTSGSKR